MVLRRSSSDEKKAALLLSGPCVSMTIDTNSYWLASSTYLDTLRAAAESAALAYQRKPQLKPNKTLQLYRQRSCPRRGSGLPRHGTSVRPSGRFPPVPNKLAGYYFYAYAILERTGKRWKTRPQTMYSYTRASTWVFRFTVCTMTLTSYPTNLTQRSTLS
jgi:hypothetical protein